MTLDWTKPLTIDGHPAVVNFDGYHWHAVRVDGAAFEVRLKGKTRPTTYVDMYFDQKGTPENNFGWGDYEPIVIENILLLNIDLPITAITKDGEAHPFKIIARVDRPNQVIGFWQDNSRSKITSTLIILDLMTAKVVPYYAGDTGGSALTFKNVPRVITHYDELKHRGTPVSVTLTDGEVTGVTLR